MSINVHFEGSPEVGAYALLTNKYCIVGKSTSRTFYSAFQETLELPIVEAYINTIPTVGSLARGNKYGLLLPHNINDNEMQHLRNSLPEDIKIKRVMERLNALGNVLLCNDHICIVHPEVDATTKQIIGDTLNVDVIATALGSEPLVGTFGVMNNIGLLVHPNVSVEECEELASMLEVSVIAGTVNKGNNSVGGGCVVNDFVAFTGHRTTFTEKNVIESVFKLVKGEDEEAKKRALIDTFID